jgi:hypothetical protein
MVLSNSSPAHLLCLNLPQKIPDRNLPRRLLYTISPTPEDELWRIIAQALGFNRSSVFLRGQSEARGCLRDARDKISILRPIRAEKGRRRERANRRDARRPPGRATAS